MSNKKKIMSLVDISPEDISERVVLQYKQGTIDFYGYKSAIVMELSKPNSCQCGCHPVARRSAMLYEGDFDKLIEALRKAKKVVAARKKKGHI